MGVTPEAGIYFLQSYFLLGRPIITKRRTNNNQVATDTNKLLYETFTIFWWNMFKGVTCYDNLVAIILDVIHSGTITQFLRLSAISDLIIENCNWIVNKSLEDAPKAANIQY